MIELGLKHGIITSGTSLIVLTSLEDYLKHRIIPSKQLKDMRQKYVNEIFEEEKKEEERIKEKVERILSTWNRRVKWHKRDFETEFSISEPKRSQNNSGSLSFQQMSQQISPEQLEELRQAFSLFDTDGNGVITREGLRGVLNQLGTNPTDEELDEMMAECDTDGSGAIDFEGFSNLMSQKLGDVDSEQEIREAFGLFDKDGCGAISVDELRLVMSSLIGEELTQEELDEMLREKGLQDAIEIDFETFKSMMMHDSIASKTNEDGKESGVSQSSNHRKNKTFVSGDAIQVKAFVESGADYAECIKKSKRPYDEYIVQRDRGKYHSSPSFYLDCSDVFWNLAKEKDIKTNEEETEGENEEEPKMSYIDIAIRVLSNIIELELDNPQLYRIVGYRLDQFGEYDLSVEIFQHVKKMKPEEPQSYRDLALVLEKQIIHRKNIMSNTSSLYNEKKEVIMLLYKVVTGKWDGRFSEIELTAIIEMNHALFRLLGSSQKEEEEEMKRRIIEELCIDPKFIYQFDCDIRISMAWDTDMTDIDLHVRDLSSNEHCYYGNRSTSRGGHLSRDFVQGYGPEEYFQRRVWVTDKLGKGEKKKVVFKVSAKYFASHQQGLTGGTTVLLSFWTNYMRSDEKYDMVTIRLNQNKEEIDVCSINFYVEGIVD